MYYVYFKMRNLHFSAYFLDFALSYIHNKQYVQIYYGKIKILINFMKFVEN